MTGDRTAPSGEGETVTAGSARAVNRPSGGVHRLSRPGPAETAPQARGRSSLRPNLRCCCLARCASREQVHEHTAISTPPSTLESSPSASAPAAPGHGGCATRTLIPPDRRLDFMCSILLHLQRMQAPGGTAARATGTSVSDRTSISDPGQRCRPPPTESSWARLSDRPCDRASVAGASTAAPRRRPRTAATRASRAGC